MCLALLALGVARVSLAQAPARVGWLSLHSAGMYHELTERGFVRGLREAGYEEGRNLVFIKRSADGDVRKLGALAREIAQSKVDVIFAPAKPMADAAWFASRQIPTVIATVTDPVVVQYADSLARPGKHITGVTTANAELIGKRLQILTELVPGLKRVGTFTDKDLLDSCGEEMSLMEKSAAKLGVTIVRIPAEYADPEAAVKRAVAAKVQA
ncbi:MAG: ABC transporter substrate-binding protein, partial [Burkholderiales bacterium]